jgi:ferric-chelate reductase
MGIEQVSTSGCSRDCTIHPHSWSGFLVLAQLSILFLLATKNNVIAVLMRRGWEKLNFLHRWVGRGVFLSATIHGASWINNHIRIDPSALKDNKELLGMAAYGVLCVIVLSSLRPVRFAAYQIFFIVQ